MGMENVVAVKLQSDIAGAPMNNGATTLEDETGFCSIEKVEINEGTKPGAMEGIEKRWSRWSTLWQLAAGVSVTTSARATAGRFSKLGGAGVLNWAWKDAKMPGRDSPKALEKACAKTSLLAKLPTKKLLPKVRTNSPRWRLRLRLRTGCYLLSGPSRILVGTLEYKTPSYNYQ